jgi:hypothetical protein
VYEDCSKYLKKAKIGFILIGTIFFLGLLVKLEILGTFNTLILFYDIVVGITAIIYIQPYINCLSQYKDKKF